MHHARKIYKTESKKQHRQIMCPTIPNVGMKKMRDKKSYDAEHPRHLADLHHQDEHNIPGGPVNKNL
ncbi:MAG: hypothetical protein KCHDKBKB_01352 [Elusimicrobia bacterium]|nr:hypothetical protein [Elusimicrobiota bacterium]